MEFKGNHECNHSFNYNGIYEKLYMDSAFHLNTKHTTVNKTTSPSVEFTVYWERRQQHGAKQQSHKCEVFLKGKDKCLKILTKAKVG